MACKTIQSSYSSQMLRKYDVFVSFRGKDTRFNFIDHLFAALHKNNILTFRDDTKLKKSKPITSELLQAIEGSQIFIVVFSKNYASSTWCLRELAKMVNIAKATGKHVLPIFYDVDPSEVRKQSGDFGKAFVEHEKRFKEDLGMLQTWRDALAHVANLSGWDVRNKPQYAEIQKIVEAIITLLGHNLFSLPKDLVGMHSRIKQLERLLILASDDDVRILGICGLGGIGKTTLAHALYLKISHEYDACCFIDDVSKIYRDCGPIGAQKQLLCQTLNEENLHICNVSKATHLIRTRSRHVKAFIVLDNVDHIEQLEKLAMNREWLGAGSRIIITSRDMHILREYGVDEVYNLQLLNDVDALKLFCQKAFKADDIVGDYRELTYDVLRYAKGLPLAIKVLGSFLYGLDISEWRSALDKLRKMPNKNIMDVLQISFDGLDEMEQETFIDIACFFNNLEEQYVKKVLCCCGFHPDIEIRVLIDKSLINIWSGKIMVHDLLQELAKKIVKGNSPNEPGKWRRLWKYDDLCNVDLKNTAAEAIVLDYANIYKSQEELRVEPQSTMSHLRLLILKCKISSRESFNIFSNKLQYLEWHEYPFTCFPSSFQPDKLVELILPHSNIKVLWEGIKPLHNLRGMNLCHSKNLIKMPDFRSVPNLVWLNLERCEKLVQIDASIGLLRKLASLKLNYCKNLVSIPRNIFDHNSLIHLGVHGCSKLFINHVEHLNKLDINETALQSQILLDYFKCLSLRYLNLSFCNLRQIPDAIGWLLCLERLDLDGNYFVTLPCSIKELSRLVVLNLNDCNKLKYYPELPLPTILSPTKRIEENFVVACQPRLSVFNNCYTADCKRLQSNAFSWMIKVLQLHYESSSYPSKIEVTIPGSQIPSWFNNQSEGSSISIDLSPIMHDNNWIGIICCAVFSGEAIRGMAYHDMAPDVLMHFRDIQNRQISKSYYVKQNLECDFLDHLWLLYLPRERFIHCISGPDDLDGIQLCYFTPAHGLYGCTVENCGYHWVFKRDLEQQNPIVMHNRTISVGSSTFSQNDDSTYH